MSYSYFDDKTKEPDDDDLSQVLGKVKKYWDAIIDDADKKCDSLVREWKFYGKKHGWQLKLSYKKRAVLYMIPHQGSFLAGMALKEPAVDMVRTSKIPPSIIKEIENSKAYPEGKPARIEVSTQKHVDIIKQLIAIKLSA